MKAQTHSQISPGQFSQGQIPSLSPFTAAPALSPTQIPQIPGTELANLGANWYQLLGLPESQV